MNLFDELRYTLKVLAKNFHFTLLCVSVLAIGIGIVLPLYTVIDNLRLKNPPLERGERYVTISKTYTDPRRRFPLSKYDAFHFDYFKNNAVSFASLQAWRDATVIVSDGDYADIYRSAELEPGMLLATGVRPLAGRLFSADDVAVGAEPVVVISYELWQSYYAGREDIVGRQSRINGQARTIVGVMPEQFSFPVSHQLWLPLAPVQSAAAGEGAEDLVIVGILGDDKTLKQANAEIQLLQAQLLSNWPQAYPLIGSSGVVPYTRILGGGPPTFTPLLLLASVMLLVAINVGNLFVARGAERMQELTIRSAVGASISRISLALMLESFLVCVAGLFFGLLIAYFGLSWVNQILANIDGGAVTNVFWWDMTLNIRIVSVACVATLAVWAVSGGLPAWRISRSSLDALLTGSNKGQVDQGTSRISKVLVNVQLVFGCVLLTLGIIQALATAGLQLPELAGSARLFTGRITFDQPTGADEQAKRTYLDSLAQQLAMQEGVDDVAFTTLLPGNDGLTLPYTVEDQNLLVNELYPNAFQRSVSSNYFDVLDIALVQGRSFGTEDTATSLPVAIVDQRLADAIWPGQSAIGKRIQLNPPSNSPWLTIVGVSTASMQESNLRAGQAGAPVIYRPLKQATPAQLSVVISSAQPGFDFRAAIRVAAMTSDRDIPVNNLESVSELEAANADLVNFNMRIFYVFMLIAVYLTGAATYGLAARAAGRRRKETGIRMALGASHAVSLRVFLKDGFRMVIGGLVLGGALAIFISYVSLAENPSVNAFALLVPTALLIAFIMGTLVMLANYFPAKKIIAMEPADALRHE